MMFAFTEDHLEAMFSLANFEIPTNEMIFFGLRGVSPVDPDGGFAASHMVQEKGVDFLHMRCTIGQWDAGNGIALYPGSTVPHLSGVTSRVANNGEGVNMLATCYLTDLPGSSDHRYAKGNHGISSPLGPHRAFRNAAKLPIWRTGDDSDYEGDDRLLYFQAFDNLHCGRRIDMNTPKFSSLGCQVVAGQPGGPVGNPGGEKGAWKSFIDVAYGLGQQRFRYALFNEGEATRTAALGVEARAPTVRFGSTGELAQHLQEGLEARGFDIGSTGADGIIGFQTLRAIRDVQLEAFGASEVDLVVGPMTAAAIGVPWPAPESAGSSFGGGVGRSSDGLGSIDDIDPDDENDDGDAVAAAPSAAAFEVETRREPRDNGRFRWVFDDPTDGTRRYLGSEARFTGFLGLARTRGFVAEAAPAYSHRDWQSEHGAWAALIEPTGEGESRNSFTCLNSYDRASFTFGFYQLAAHTPNDNLILLFRKLLAKDEAAVYFPDLTLSGGKVHMREGGVLTSLEGAQDRSDNANRDGEQGAFMEYLNGDMHGVDDAERRAASRLIHWACHSETHRRVQVEVAVELAKKKVARIAQKMEARETSLDGRAMPIVAMALDILHNGRGGRTTFAQIANALKSNNPMKALKKIGRTSTFADRIDRVATRARNLLGRGTFGALRYDKDTNNFV
ncbi:peptidoglycan-binding domain-containing protein [uncultured Ruegeria sp.]|uniref:peptidoglycan-binding domain-containing protein n=1 Tax=uncultured Ruegeria sp. TaxID=259304 RepID=UPI00262B3142|nr:peptidoglycan-binding domain-containing protein [uncultured Ruegeria sp.]